MYVVSSLTEVEWTSKFAELLQNPKTYTSHKSWFARQETGSDLTKIVRR